MCPGQYSHCIYFLTDFLPQSQWDRRQCCLILQMKKLNFREGQTQDLKQGPTNRKASDCSGWWLSRLDRLPPGSGEMEERKWVPSIHGQAPPTQISLPAAFKAGLYFLNLILIRLWKHSCLLMKPSHSPSGGLTCFSSPPPSPGPMGQQATW